MEKIYVPFEVFRKMPNEDADKLQNELMHLYFKNNPDVLRNILERAEGDQDLIDTYKDEEFKRVMSRDYAYDINILRRRKEDPVANLLVERIDDFNMRLESGGVFTE